ncbi:flagellar hook-basal body complex protein [Caproiciproducens galactitolivorans]|uniref:Flagellar hook protein FlgE n=1 Tax=Caproiciproducens galactitolivorans TaxID=642589 RepID=A0ABT4BSF5_9FIRM|nr:flagellar hook-basal body complex protein [Caproiciproducens galactitolivorans]MCY1713033.1 flagellar hook-basal body complex protein [Caproiciproducens galactitolivorans]
MSTAMYCGIAGTKAYQTGMDVIGNNISNVNTYGFKASRVMYRDLFYQTLQNSTSASGGFGGSNPSQVGYGATASTVDVLNTRSGRAPTGSSNDCYIDGEGYFVVDDGTTGKLYTRVGSFSFDGSGNLVDGNGRLVYGVDTSGALALVKVEKYNDYKDIKIGSDGTITGTPKAGGDIATLGSIAVANIPNPSGLTQMGGSYYRADGNAQSATIKVSYSKAGANGTGQLITSALETSNTDLANELTQMIINERGFQANTKIITVSDEMMETLVNMKR